MSEYILKENKSIKEKYYISTLASGFKITVIPKDIPTYSAFLCCDIGQADVEYVHRGERFSFPDGTAHFLEHKMFENSDGSDAFGDFNRFGGNANAFTSYENTCYYFTCSENFFDNLDVLLKSVSSFHCTKRSVDKERRIIAREISMYDDLPHSAATRGLYRALYHRHPITMPISGTKETIGNITKDVLYRAYEHFYVPSNLSLCVCGRADKEKIYEYASKYFGKIAEERPTTVFAPEPLTVVSKEDIGYDVVASPLFSAGIKCIPFGNKKADLRAISAMRLAISLLFGRSSDFYCSNYESGLLNERFYAGLTVTKNASHIVFSGSSENPHAVFEKAIEEITRRKTDFFTEERILREKKAAYAESLSVFDSGEDIASLYAVDAFTDYDEFDCIEAIGLITPEEIHGAISSIDVSNSAISIRKGQKI